VLSQGAQDAIREFNLTGDIISLAGWGIADLAALGDFMPNVDGNIFINLDATHELTCLGMAPAGLLANDFLFA